MKRHPSLHALSEHHHHLLVQALSIRRLKAASAGVEGWRRLARDFLHFWRRAGSRHFREEEEILLPAYARHLYLNQDGGAMQMMADHAAIRARIARLKEALAAGAPLESHLTELGQLLHNHVRLEEDEVFPRIEATLTPQELRALRQRLIHLHTTRERKPHAPGSRRK